MAPAAVTYSKKLFFTASFFSILTAMSGLPGCGGGTSGTGGLSVTGSISDTGVRMLSVSNNRAAVAVTPTIASNTNTLGYVPLANVVVTLQGTAESDITDENGNFYITAPKNAVTGPLILNFNGKDFNSTYNVSNIPLNSAQVQLQLHVDRANDSIHSDSEDFKDGDGNDIEHREGRESELTAG